MDSGGATAAGAGAGMIAFFTPAVLTAALEPTDFLAAALRRLGFGAEPLSLAARGRLGVESERAPTIRLGAIARKLSSTHSMTVDTGM